MKRTKTAKMKKVEKRVEKRFAKPLDEVIVELLEGGTMRMTAAELGISVSLLGYWMLKLDIEIERVVIRSGQKVLVVDP